MNNIITSETQTALWQKLIIEAQQLQHQTLSEDLENYLVFTLMGHIQDKNIGHRALGLDYLTINTEASMELTENLRELAERCLLITGLFPEHAEKRKVPLTYYIDLGKGAYHELSAQATKGLATLFSTVAEAFIKLVKVLLGIRQMDQNWPNLTPLAVYELNPTMQKFTKSKFIH